MKLTQEALQIAHDVLTKGVIQAVFQHQENFKGNVLNGLVGWEDGCYTIERCHMANRFRITLKHEDGREKDLYIDSGQVYRWVVQMVEEINNEI